MALTGAERQKRYYERYPDRCKVAVRKHYSKQIERVKARQKETRKKVAELKQVPCADCGNVFPPVCMDFDHRPGETKMFGIANAMTRSWDSILVEIAKCDIVCANCHRIRTQERTNGSS